MLAIGDTARDLKIETADTGAVVAEIDLVVWKRARFQVGKEEEGARPARARRKVVDGIALDVRPLLNRAVVSRPLLADRRQRNRLAIRRLERYGPTGQPVVRRLVPHRDTDFEQHPLFADRTVSGLVSDDHVAFVVVCDPDELALQSHDLRHPGLG